MASEYEVMWELFLTLCAPVPPEVVDAVIRVESAYVRTAVGDDGRSYGLMQIRLSTARQMGFRGRTKELMDPGTNVLYGCRYLRQQVQEFGDLRTALDAYNRGPGNVRRWPWMRKRRRWEDHPYVGKVMNVYQRRYHKRLE